MSQNVKNIVIAVCLIGSGLMILDSLNAGHAIAYFLLAGIIPGTTIILSSSDLLAFYALAFGFIFARLFSAAIRRFGLSLKRV